MRFYVIGSCRVHGPLRGRPGYGKPVVGYTHTTKEAIQRVRHIRGEIVIAHSVAPYVFSRERTPVVTAAHRRALNDADVMLVEVCSAKEMQYMGFWLNLNYAQNRELHAPVQEAAELERDLRALMRMVPRLVVVTHVDLPGIEDRARFSDRVRSACEKLDIPVFSPADHVGPDDMLDANHYKPDVVRQIGDRLMEFLCKPET
ncbi:hypothetical protein ABRY94_11730 [Castellaniella ginsengisoli]|uniref:Uncharacterized protein n=1 Tax=Castellaniella ginsengisoli TaxID=546114 RepID=A0AB39EPR0_9BURK